MKAFEAFRPTPPADSKGAVAAPSYGPLAMPMLVYVGAQGLV